MVVTAAIYRCALPWANGATGRDGYRVQTYADGGEAWEAFSRSQLAHRERLAEVVVGAELEAEHPVELREPTGDTQRVIRFDVRVGSRAR